MPKENKNYQIAILETQVAKLIDVIATQGSTKIGGLNKAGGKTIIKELLGSFNHHYRQSIARLRVNKNAYRAYKSTGQLRASLKQRSTAIILAKEIHESDLGNAHGKRASINLKQGLMLLCFGIYEVVYVLGHMAYRMLRKARSMVR